MARAHEEDGVLLVVGDEAVHVAEEEVDARRGSPVADEAVLDVLTAEALAHERVAAEVDLADGEVVRGAPVAVDALELLLGHRAVELLPRGANGGLCHVLLPSSCPPSGGIISYRLQYRW